MKIRKARKEDVGQIAKVEKESGYHLGKWNFLEMIEDLLKDKNEFVYVAEINNKIIGYRSFNKKNILADSGYLAVVKRFQGKGVGEALMKYSIKEARKLNCKKMILNVKNDNFRAISLYNKLEFCVVDYRKKGKITKLIMEKKL